MPSAVAKRNRQRYELESLEGGFVVLRRLNYGETLKRQELLQNFEVKEDQNGRASGNVSANLEAASVFAFSISIIEHNLTDDDDKPLNFSNQTDVLNLDPAVAEEIDNLIQKHNGPRKSSEEKLPLSSTSDGQSEPKVEASTSVKKQPAQSN